MAKSSTANLGLPEESQSIPTDVGDEYLSGREGLNIIDRQPYASLALLLLFPSEESKGTQAGRNLRVTEDSAG